MIRKQRLALDAKIRSICRAHIVRKGLPYFKAGEPREGLPSAQQAQQAGWSPPPVPLDIASIPGVMEACWTPDQAVFGSR